MIAESQVLPDISDHRYTIRIAKKEEEIEKALKLRYKIFYEELNRKFDSTKTIDRDEYDDQCHHLIVKENKSNMLVGTYRLQTYEQAMGGAGFYSDSIFKLNELSDSILTQSFEVGRACIEENHRNGRVLYLLWKGFAGYLQHFEKRYLFGSFGVPFNKVSDGSVLYNQFQKKNQLHPEYLINPREEYKYDLHEYPENNQDEINIPPLLQNYLDIGCNICSKPAFYKSLGLFHVMVLMDVKKITPKIQRMFFS